MKPKCIDPPQQRVMRREAVRGATLYCLMQLLAVLALVGLRQVVTEGWVDTLLLVLAVLDLLSIPPVFLVLRQRLHEIKGGELDAARKY